MPGTSDESPRLRNIEREARIDLAAALRLAVANGFHEGIDNHFSLEYRTIKTVFCRIPMACIGRRCVQTIFWRLISKVM